MNNLKKSNTITMLIICVIIVVITAYVLKFIEERCDVMYTKCELPITKVTSFLGLIINL